MKKHIIQILSLILAAVLMLSLVGCDFNNVPSSGEPLPDYGISYKTQKSIPKTWDGYGYADYGQEITLTLKFGKAPNVLVTVQESDAYEIIGSSEFNTNDYEPDGENHINIDIKIKINADSEGVQYVNIRLFCLCGEEDCGRFSMVSDGHYFDVPNFYFYTDTKGVLFNKDHDRIDYHLDDDPRELERKSANRTIGDNIQE